MFTVEELNQIEREALELRRRKYANQLAKIDRSVLSAAAEGDIAAARLAYQRFEGWSEKRLQEHSGKDGKPIDHSMTMDEMAAQLLAEVAGATRGLPNRTQEKIWD